MPSLRLTYPSSVTRLLLLMLLQMMMIFPPAHANDNAVPASIFHHSYQDLQKQHQRFDIDSTIFNPVFINYIMVLTSDRQKLNKQDVNDAVDRWNYIAQSKLDHISFNSEHFDRFAALSNNNDSNCSNEYACHIDKRDLQLLRRWLRWRELLVAHNSATVDMTRGELLKLNTEHHSALQRTLFRLSRDEVGRMLLDNALSQGTIIRVRSLDGMHGYFDFSKNEIVIDKTVAYHEFNLRYLAHELVHVLNKDNTNSIMEEVFAELIGLHVQNSVTSITIKEHPYTVFVRHLLHAHYGNLNIDNEIESHLQNAGMKYSIK